MKEMMVVGECNIILVITLHATIIQLHAYASQASAIRINIK